MDISIIIVSWNVRELLKKCLQSINAELVASQLTGEVIVVDNNSQDGSVEMMHADFSKTKIIANDFNAGFARANNQGVQVASGKFLLILNPDTELQLGSLRALIDCYQRHPEAGAIGPKLLNPDRTLQPSVRRLPSLAVIMATIFKLQKIKPQAKIFQNYQAVDFDYTREQKAEQIMGACMLIPRELVKNNQVFDPRYFVWFDEVDLCRELYLAGHPVYYTPTAEVVHHGGRSFIQQGTLIKQYRFLVSSAHYVWKWLGQRTPHLS